MITKVGVMNSVASNGSPHTKAVHKPNMAKALGYTAIGTSVGLLGILSKDEVKVGHYKVIGYETDKNGVPIDGPDGFIPKMEWTNDPTFFQKLQIKIRETFKVDFSKVPEGVDPTKPYLTDKDGYYLSNDIGLIPNPWYNEELTKSTIDKIGSVGEIKDVNTGITETVLPSMHKTLSDFTNFGNGTTDNIEGHNGIIVHIEDGFQGETVSVDDSFIDKAINVIGEIFHNFMN